VKLVCVDMFCGGGGSSGGLIEAAKELGFEIELLAINHWDLAVQTHAANYPWARHICARVDQVDPRSVIPGGRVHLMIAGPECTHHSRARGSRPVEDQKRVPAWGILPWLTDLYVDNLIIENVPEFRDWAPLGSNGKPLKSAKGQTYNAYLNAIRALNYKVIDGILCCADHGDFTSRQRLFIQATRRGSPTFPLPTHSPEGEGTLFTQPWRPARAIIDWTISGPSIFDRKKSLVPKTLRRIAAGMMKFNGIDISSHLAAAGQRGTTQELVEVSNGVTAIEGEPFLVAAGGPEGKGRNPKSVHKPLGTVLTENHEALVRPFLVVVNHTDKTTSSSARCSSLDKPFPTVTCKNGFGLVTSYLTKYYGTSVTAQSLEDPLDSVTTRDRFALVEPAIVSADKLANMNGRQIHLIPLGNGLYLDIRFRMLQWHELAGAQGFPKGYVFAGSKAKKVKQIGNAVPRYTARALCLERLKTYIRPAPSAADSLLVNAAC
jgi:DNA (cytosine-5)-methyltransferase 1